MNTERIDVVALREDLGWTQQQLADYCGALNRSTVSKWETDPPTKGPAFVLLRDLRKHADRQIAQARSQDADSVTSGPDAADLKASGPVLSHEAAA